MVIRKANPDDASALCRIYNHYVVHTAVTFETDPVSEAEMGQRILEVQNENLPYFVLEVEGRVVGYYYVHKWRNRCAYSSTKEVTVYLDKEYVGKGLGSLLYEHMLQQIDPEQTHVLIAGICIPNDGSVRLHEKFGFVQVSTMKEVGRKFDEWRDVGHWMLTLGKTI